MAQHKGLLTCPIEPNPRVRAATPRLFTLNMMSLSRFNWRSHPALVQRNQMHKCHSKVIFMYIIRWIKIVSNQENIKPIKVIRDLYNLYSFMLNIFCFLPRYNIFTKHENIHEVVVANPHGSRPAPR